MCIGRNDDQGAWNKEGRSIFTEQKRSCKGLSPDLYNACSAGFGSVTKRIDSNGYILSLIEDYEFVLHPRPGYSIADVFPQNNERVKWLLYDYLSDMKFPNTLIAECLQFFDNGFFSNINE